MHARMGVSQRAHVHIFFRQATSGEGVQLTRREAPPELLEARGRPVRAVRRLLLRCGAEAAALTAALPLHAAFQRPAAA